MVQSCGQRNDKKGFLNFDPKIGKNCGQFRYKIGKKLWSKNYSRICLKFWSNLLSKMWSAILGQNFGLKRVYNFGKKFLIFKEFIQNMATIFVKICPQSFEEKNSFNIFLQTFDPNLV